MSTKLLPSQHRNPHTFDTEASTNPTLEETLTCEQKEQLKEFHSNLSTDQSSQLEKIEVLLFGSDKRILIDSQKVN